MTRNKTLGLIAGSIIAALLFFKLFQIYKSNNPINNIAANKEIKMEKTFAIIKPDAVKAKNSGKIIDRIEQEGFEIVGMKKTHLTKDQAEQFYAVHKERPFFASLVEFMTSGPVVVMTLQKENAIKAWRDLMGATDPAQAPENSLRKLYGTDKGENATHGSDAPETAAVEIKFFFPELAN
jgi:nucleoside-diphosphate kinase